MDRDSDKGGELRPSPTDDAHSPLRKEARDWLVLLASGDIQDDDRSRLKQWLDASPVHQEAFDREAAVWRNLAQVKAQLEPAAINARATQAARPGRTRPLRFAGVRRTGFATAVIAFGLILLAVSDDILVWLQADYRTFSGEQEKIALADGSIAHLNTDSAISIDYSESQRQIVLLRGEAYFAVARNPDHPFVVASHNGNSRAVGTGFAVRDDSGTVLVTVASGRVEVVPPASSAGAARPRHRIELSANQQTIYRDGGTNSGVREVDANAILGWREGRIVVDNMPFQDAISELDRYMPGRILIASTRQENTEVSGVFSPDRLNSALRVLAATQGLTVHHVTPYLVLLY